MAKPNQSNPVAFAGLLIAASVLAVTIYLNYSHAPSSLMLAESQDAVATEETAAVAETVSTDIR